MNVLFIGNSLIYYNDMPKIFASVAGAKGKDVFVDSVTKGGGTISDFASSDTAHGIRAREALKSRKWDYVIIEPSRRITPYESTVYEAELESAKIMKALADEAGAQLMLYSVWGNNTGKLLIYEAKTPTELVLRETVEVSRSAHTGFMHGVSERFSEQLGGVKIIESGYAFENMIGEEPSETIYHSDGRHPSPAGSFLAACTVFSAIYGERTSDADYCYELEKSLAERLRRVSDETVMDSKVPILEAVM